MPKIPFGEWLPDLPVYLNTGATVAKNVLPKTGISYGPFNSLVTNTGALTARCQGAYSARDAAAASYTFAGDATKLYLAGAVTGGAIPFGDVSRAVGGAYSLGADSHWNFVQFGQRIIAAGNGNDLQSFLMATSTKFAQLSATAPQARYICVIRDFVMVGYTYDGVGGTQPNRVWWCAIDDPTNWPTPGTAAAKLVESDFQNLPEGGAVTGTLGGIGGADGAVFMEEAIYRVGYEGPPTIFRFDKVERAQGTMVPGSIISKGDIAFYLAYNGFNAFDGSRSVPIGTDRIDRTFYADFDQSYSYRMTGTVDVVNRVVMWIYPGAGNTSGLPNKLIAFNYQTNRWSIVEINLEYLFTAYTKSYTLENLDNFSTSIDTLQYSLDSPIWTSNSLYLAGFDSTHKMGSFTGATLAATIETGEMDGGEGQRLFLTGIRPIVDGGTVTAAIGVRDTQSGTITYTTPTSAGVDGVCPQRQSSRYARAQVDIAAGSVWTHAQGVEYQGQPDGER